MHLHTKKGWVKRVQATAFGLAYGRTVRCRETAYSGDVVASGGYYVHFFSIFVLYQLSGKWGLWYHNHGNVVSKYT
jgi:hypothetical protein